MNSSVIITDLGGIEDLLDLGGRKGTIEEGRFVERPFSAGLLQRQSAAHDAGGDGWWPRWSPRRAVHIENGPAGRARESKMRPVLVGTM